MEITAKHFAEMEQSVAKECDGMDEINTGVAVTLWKLRSLMNGYRFALDLGYGWKENHEERETSP
jgi:hypothetical protein